MALRHVAALVLFAAFVQPAGVPALAQNAPITNAPITGTPRLVLPPDALPDMAITFMQTTPICMPNGTTTANIKVTVTNIGKAKADLSKIPWSIIVSADWWAVTYELLAKAPPPLVWPQAGGPASFAPGQSWTTTLTIAGIPAMKKNVKIPGAHGVAVHLDPGNKLAESNEMNNHRHDLFYDVCAYVK